MSIRSIRYARQAASLACAAAVGALSFSVHVAALVFREMPDDRMTAGRVAGRAFVGAYAIAIAAASIAVVVAFATLARTRDRVLAAVFLGLSALQLLWIAPAIVNHGAGWPGTFASLHAAGGALHLVLAVLALLLAWLLLDETTIAH